MYKSIQTSHQIQAPVEAVWSLIYTGAHWEDWFPILTGSQVEGNKRFCVLDNGDTLEELFLASQVRKTFVYGIQQQQSFPAENIVGILQLKPNGEDTQLDWSVEMEVEDEPTFQMLREQIVKMYRAAAATLQELAKDPSYSTLKQ